MEQPGKPIPDALREFAERIARHVNHVAVVMMLLVVLFFFIALLPEPIRITLQQAETTAPAAIAPLMDEGIVNGIHVETGFIVDTNWEIVRATCTACHSAKLVTQNRADREGWTKMIRWMQKTQKLWDLGADEGPILDYLSTHYAPEKKGRRARLTNIEWYDLKP